MSQLDWAIRTWRDAAAVAHRRQHQEIASYLRKAIRDSSIPPGSAIPSEAELDRQSGMAHGTARQAVSTLRSEGLVSSGQGRRTRVLDTVPTFSFDEVISFTQWCQKAGTEPGQQTQQVTCRPAGSELAVHLEISDTDQIISVLGLRLMDGEPVMIEKLNYPLDVGKHILTFDTDPDSIYRHLLDNGMDIAYATRMIDAVSANGEDTALLKIQVDAPLLRVRRRAFTPDGVPIEASDDRYLASEASFSVTMAWGNTSPILLQAGEGVR